MSFLVCNNGLGVLTLTASGVRMSSLESSLTADATAADKKTNIQEALDLLWLNAMHRGSKPDPLWL